ncbi:MAG TPA: hypothetical protein PKA27_11335 [Fimbriimonadaceae bacterium]|nr:hypothetical protein [Fimbriimonadaceae bacterium]
MKRLDDELIAQYAFGELSSAEAAEVEALLIDDAEAMKVSRAYQGMSLNLRSLQSVPEPQLSADRLRARILEEGLKPKRPMWNLPWTLGPALVGAAAFAFAFLRSGSGPEQPVVVAKNEIPSMKVALKEPSFEDRPVSTVLAEAQRDQKSVPQVVAKVSRRTKRVKPIVRNEPEVIVVAAKTSAKKDEAASFDAGPKEEVNRESGMSTMAMGAQPDVAMPASEPLVLIQPETDRGTGANRATEVSATNVTIGG